ncbi:hypothetical protein EDD17DRAFT_1574240 [Pisolithus thermaeus]|nr:hypothetical protein EDD17DRAFT_1574240 [Pisolithus thermaeus]
MTSTMRQRISAVKVMFACCCWIVVAISDTCLETVCSWTYKVGSPRSTMSSIRLASLTSSMLSPNAGNLGTASATIVTKDLRYSLARDGGIRARAWGSLPNIAVGRCMRILCCEKAEKSV